MDPEKGLKNAPDTASELPTGKPYTPPSTEVQKPFTPSPDLAKPKQKKLWYILIPIALVLLAGVLYFVTPLKKPDTKKAYTGPMQKLVVSNIGEYTIFNLIAKQKGYFAQNGLDVQLKEYEVSPPIMKDLFDKKIQIGLGSENAGVNNIFVHKDLRILTRVSKQDVFQVIGRKDKGILQPADLKGKRVGVTTKSIGEFFLGRFLTLHNLNFQDVTIVNLTPKEMVTQITNGQIDAVLVFDPHVYNIKKSLGDQVVSWSATSGQRTHTLLYALDSYTKSNPDTVRRYIKSLAMAEDAYNKNRQIARDIGIQDLHYTPDYIDTVWSRVTFSLGLDQEMLLTMEDQARWTIDNKLTNQTKVPNYVSYIYFDALKKVKPDAVSIIY